MYDREVDVPRLRTHFDLHASDVPEVVQRAYEAVCEVAPAPYTSVGLNLYRSGNDSVAPHNDRLAELVPGEPISLLSLGGPRDMVISSKAKSRRPIHLSLESGSVLVMDYISQLNYLHGVPKVSNAHPRISLAFRVRPKTTIER
jgi:alkylated DNA repair dioxygenase AlkB